MFHPLYIRKTSSKNTTKKVSKRANLNAAVAEMIESKGAYFLEVKVGKENNVFPMVPTGASVSEIRLK